MDEKRARESAEYLEAEFGSLRVDYDIEVKKKPLSTKWIIRVVRRAQLPMSRVITTGVYRDYVTYIPGILSRDVKHSLKEDLAGVPTLTLELNISIDFSEEQLSNLVKVFERRIKDAVFRLGMSSPW